MKKILAAATLAAAVAFPSVALADLESFLRSVDAKAKSDIRNFNAQLSAQFGIPVPNIEVIVRSVPRPSDAFMVLHVSQTTRSDPDRVLRTYKANQGKGWGVVAQRMGIKPGSPEFHALKRGDLAFTGRPRSSQARYDDGERGRGGDHGPGAGKGMGRGGKGF
jgi:hypothetical protein